MTEAPVERQPRRAAALLRWLLALALAAMLFGAGLAVGEALHDNPQPGITQTSVRTLHP